MKVLLTLSVAAAACTAATLGAQVAPAPAKPDSACTTYPDGRVECRIYRRGRADSALRRIFYRTDSTMARRAALGIEVRATGTRRDTLGVFVNAVTPKGPAETAGIVEGDRIASINGVDLRTPAADTEDSYITGLAAHRLTREVQKLTPGARVTLRIYSGGRFRDVQVTTGKASDVMRFGNRMMMPGPGGMRWQGPGGAMMFGPDMPMLRENWEPLMKERIEPLLRERLKDLPNRIQLRSPTRVRTFAPLRVRMPRVYKANGELLKSDGPEVFSLDAAGPLFDGGDLLEFDRAWDVDGQFDFDFDLGEPFLFDGDDDLIQFTNEIEEVLADTVRELAATAIRDARVALRQLSSAGIA